MGNATSHPGEEEINSFLSSLLTTIFNNAKLALKVSEDILAMNYGDALAHLVKALKNTGKLLVSNPVKILPIYALSSVLVGLYRYGQKQGFKICSRFLEDWRDISQENIRSISKIFKYTKLLASLGFSVSSGIVAESIVTAFSPATIILEMLNSMLNTISGVCSSAFHEFGKYVAEALKKQLKEQLLPPLLIK